MRISITDTATPRLIEIIDSIRNRRPIMRAVGGVAADVIQKHYQSLPGNKMGWPSSFFWEKEGSRKTQLTYFDNDSATVKVDSTAMGHKLYGGTVYPIPPLKKLAIPARSEAYLRGSPGEWSTPGELVPARN